MLRYCFSPLENSEITCFDCLPDPWSSINRRFSASGWFIHVEIHDKVLPCPNTQWMCTYMWLFMVNVSKYSTRRVSGMLIYHDWWYATQIILSQSQTFTINVSKFETDFLRIDHFYPFFSGFWRIAGPSWHNPPSQPLGNPWVLPTVPIWSWWTWGNP